MILGKTIAIRVCRKDLDKLKRVLPDDDGWTNPTRFGICLNNSLINIEDLLNGRKKKKSKK